MLDFLKVICGCRGGENYDKIWDLLRCWDPCLKMQDWNTNDFQRQTTHRKASEIPRRFKDWKESFWDTRFFRYHPPPLAVISLFLTFFRTQVVIVADVFLVPSLAFTGQLVGNCIEMNGNLFLGVEKMVAKVERVEAFFHRTFECHFQERLCRGLVLMRERVWPQYQYSPM